MTQVFPATAPELPAPSLALNEVVPLLIGATVGEIERELVLQTLARCNGNRTRAARVLGVSVRTLRNKIPAIHGRRNRRARRITTRAQRPDRKLRPSTGATREMDCRVKPGNDILDDALSQTATPGRSAHVQRPAFRHRPARILGRSLSRLREDAEAGADRVRAAPGATISSRRKNASTCSRRISRPG